MQPSSPNIPPEWGPILDALIQMLRGRRHPTITVTDGDFHATLKLPDPGPQRPAAASAEPTEGCGADILRVLRTGGCRMTQPEIIEEFTDRKLGPHSERNVTRWLGILKGQGLIDHDPRANPPGYGIVTN